LVKGKSIPRKTVRPPDSGFSAGGGLSNSALIGIAAALIAALLLLVRLQAVVTPLAAAWFIAYAFDPVLDKLESWRIPRTTGILLLILLMISLAGLLSLFGVPALLKEIRDGAAALPGYAESLYKTLEPRISALLGDAAPEALKSRMDSAAGLALEKLPDIAAGLADASSKAASTAKAAMGALINIMFVPVFAFFLLLNFNGMGEWVIDLSPRRRQKTVRRLFERSDAALGGFIRGQLAVCAILAVIYSIGLALTGIDMPLAVGTLSGALFIAPYIGTSIGILLACVLALLKFHDFIHILYVLGVFGAGQMIESFVLTPKIVGSRVGLSPLAVIIAVLAGGELFGFMGILLAVPSAAVLRVCLDEALAEYKASDFYRRTK